MRKAIFPGSFDPPTLGHTEIVARATVLFDEVVVAIGTNSAKASFFTLEERLEMAGVVVFIDALLLYLSEHHGEIQFRLSNTSGAIEAEPR